MRRAAPVDAEGASDGEFLVAVTLVGFLYGAGDVIPEADAVVERKGEYETAVGGEADVCDAGVVFVDEGAETLACRRIPDSTGWLFVSLCSKTTFTASFSFFSSSFFLRRGEPTYIRPSVEQLTTKVPSEEKSMPVTGSLCAGKLRINLPARTSQRNTASS